MTVSPPIPQLSVSISSITTTVVCGFFPSTSVRSFVTHRIIAAFFSGAAPSLVILMLTYGISLSSCSVYIVTIFAGFLLVSQERCTSRVKKCRRTVRGPVSDEVQKTVLTGTDKARQNQLFVIQITKRAPFSRIFNV